MLPTKSVCFRNSLLGKSENDKIEILLISTCQHYLEELQKNLFITRKIQAEKRPYNMNVNTCRHIKDVIDLQPDGFQVDFVVFILDINNKNCLNDVQDNMDSMDMSLGREKFCIVNPKPSHGKSAMNVFDMWKFVHENQINVINGRMDDPDRMANLSNRILDLAEACTGVLNGIPLIGYV